VAGKRKYRKITKQKAKDMQTFFETQHKKYTLKR